jgi:hypothetical protein
MLLWFVVIIPGGWPEVSLCIFLSVPMPSSTQVHYTITSRAPTHINI